VVLFHFGEGLDFLTKPQNRLHNQEMTHINCNRSWA
jgi:hypothetical protein